MRSAQNFYLSRLDHLRFFAATLVVLFHYFHTRLPDLRSGNPLVSLIDEGHTGIALFMVISGFIFTVIAGDQRLNYARFMQNRLLRIYPLFVFAVFLQLLISTYNEQRNYGFIQLIGWLVPFRSDTIPLSPYFVQLWTIWVEFQFYLIFPFLLAFSRKRGAVYLGGLLVLMMVLRALVYAATGSVRFLAYETIFGRLDQFLIGMLLARSWLRQHQLPGVRHLTELNPLWLLTAAVTVLLGLHAFSLGVGFSELASPFWIIWPPIEASLWVVFMWVYLNTRWPGPLAMRRAIDTTLSNLGNISFSIYVVHNLVIAAFKARWPNLVLIDSWAGLNVVVVGMVILLPAVLALSALTWWLIEKPFLEWRQPWVDPHPAQATPMVDVAKSPH